MDQLVQLKGSPLSDIEMATLDPEAGIAEEVPTVLEPGPSNKFADVKEKATKESKDPAMCYVCKEAAGKHSYYGITLRS